MKSPTRKLLAAFLAVMLIVSVSGAAYAEPAYTVDATGYDSSSGTFTAILYGVEDTSQVSSVQFPVWSKANQSDIIWYTANLNGDGTYSVTVQLKNHGYNIGKYNIHCYVNFNDGSSQMVGADVIDISASAGVLSVYKSDGIFYVKLEGNTIPGVATVKFPVWSLENGQDDIIWYSGNKQSDGSFIAAIDFSRHNNLGNYVVHCYVYSNDGSQIGVGTDSFSVAAPSGGTVSVTTVDAERGTYKAEVSGISNSAAVKTVRFPVWCNSDKSDIVWYTANKESDGTYTAFIDCAQHKYHAGTYTVHCYVTDICGNCNNVGGTNFTVSGNSGTISVESGGEAGIYVVRLTGTIYSKDIKSVRFPVWSEANGQDDIIWYRGVKQADGTYAATIKLANHKSFGRYFAHCYVTTKSDPQLLVCGTSFNVDEPTTGTLSATSNGTDSGSFHITYTPSGNYTGVSKVQFPVWCSSDQSDIVWYTASRQSDGSYSCDVNYARHKCHTGQYTIHAYVTDINGRRTLVTGTSFNLSVSTTNTITVTPLDSDGSRVLITITNASIPGTISSLHFPTWSSKNGQDDILWYKARNIGGNTWQATISLSNHSNSGEFITHAYANGNILLGGVSYTMTSTSSDAKMSSKIAGKSSSTPYLVAVDTTANTIGVYQGSAGNWNLVQHWSCTTGKASTPTITGEFKIGTKGTSFSGSNYTCWYYTQFCGNYLFHSVLYELGSQTDVRVGTLGANLSDGCVRLAIENARWLQNNVPVGSKVVIY